MMTRSNLKSRGARLGLLTILLAVIGVGAIFSTGRANANAASAAGSSAVAVVDLAKLLDGLDERGFMEQDLNKEIEKRQSELDQTTGELKRMEEDIKILADDDPNKIERVRDLRLKEVEARALKQFVQEQLSIEKGRMLVTLYNKVQLAVCDIAARDGWDLVLIDDSTLDLPEMATEQQMLQLILSRRVLCATDGINITDEVRTLMNNQFNAARP